MTDFLQKIHDAKCILEMREAADECINTIQLLVQHYAHQLGRVYYFSPDPGLITITPEDDCYDGNLHAAFEASGALPTDWVYAIDYEGLVIENTWPIRFRETVQPNRIIRLGPAAAVCLPYSIQNLRGEQEHE